jgi:hypothetical protein
LFHFLDRRWRLSLSKKGVESRSGGLGAGPRLTRVAGRAQAVEAVADKAARAARAGLSFGVVTQARLIAA